MSRLVLDQLEVDVLSVRLIPGEPHAGDARKRHTREEHAKSTRERNTQGTQTNVLAEDPLERGQQSSPRISLETNVT